MPFFELYGPQQYSGPYQLCRHSTISQHFMQPKNSLPRSKELSTRPCPEPNQSSLHHSSYLQDVHLMLIILLRLVFPSGLFPSVFLPITYTRSSSPPFVLHALSNRPSIQWLDLLHPAGITRNETSIEIRLVFRSVTASVV
jgi:hypothetical protein